MIDKEKKYASLIAHHAPLTLVLKRKKKKSINYCDLKSEIKRIWKMKKVKLYQLLLVHWGQFKGLQQMDGKKGIRSNS